MALWKVYSIQSGRIVKAGFDSEEDAREWLETNKAGQEDNYLAEEMDFDEQDEWLSRKKNADEDEVEEESDDDDDIEKGRYTYSTEDDDGDDDEEPPLLEDDDDGDSSNGSADGGDNDLF